MSNDDEITITLVTLGGSSESISVSASSTTLNELCDFASALLSVPLDGITLNKDGKNMFTKTAVTGREHGGKVLRDVGIRNGDLILVLTRGTARGSAGGGVRQQVTPSPPSTTGGATAGGASAPAPAGAGLGGLDFSSLLGASASPGSTRAPSSTTTTTTTTNATNTTTTTATANKATTSTTTNSKSSTGGLTFNIPGLENALFYSQLSATTSHSSQQQQQQQQPVEWVGMTLDDAIRANPNPSNLVQVLFDEMKHPNLFKELNYHHSSLARKLRQAGVKDAARVWREEVMKGSIDRAYQATMSQQKEYEMQERLRKNPLDEEANKYFGEKIRKENVEAQYRQMMEEYPESMGRVLMLYIDAEVNGHPVQAFVDSGAQSTIMSSQCAERCELLHLLDTRFEGTAVGVGTGKILGRIHITPLKIGGHYFPCSITVMDSEKGLGDKNMDFLFGLDMLKRHRCKIDLERNALVFSMEHGERHLEAPFLYEKDLDESKGGTKGFDAEKSNAELARAIEESLMKQKKKKETEGEKNDGEGKKEEGTNANDDVESGYEGGMESESMDVEDDDGKQSKDKKGAV